LPAETSLILNNLVHISHKRKHCSSTTEGQLIPLGEIVVPYSANQMQSMNTARGKAAEVLNVTARGSYTTLCFKLVNVIKRRTECFAGSICTMGPTFVTSGQQSVEWSLKQPCTGKQFQNIINVEHREFIIIINAVDLSKAEQYILHCLFR
jgi:hypothetical protein